MREKEREDQGRNKYKKVLREIFGLPLFVESPLIIKLNWQGEGKKAEVSYWEDILEIKWGEGYIHKDDERGISWLYNDDGKHIGYVIPKLSSFSFLSLVMEGLELKIHCEQISNALSILFGEYKYSIKNTQYKFIYEHYNGASAFVGFDIIDKNLFKSLNIEKIEFKF